MAGFANSVIARLLDQSIADRFCAQVLPLLGCGSAVKVTAALQNNDLLDDAISLLLRESGMKWPELEIAETACRRIALAEVKKWMTPQQGKQSMTLLRPKSSAPSNTEAQTEFNRNT